MYAFLSWLGTLHWWSVPQIKNTWTKAYPQQVIFLNIPTNRERLFFPHSLKITWSFLCSRGRVWRLDQRERLGVEILTLSTAEMHWRSPASHTLLWVFYACLSGWKTLQGHSSTTREATNCDGHWGGGFSAVSALQCAECVHLYVYSIYKYGLFNVVPENAFKHVSKCVDFGVRGVLTVIILGENFIGK